MSTNQQQIVRCSICGKQVQRQWVSRSRFTESYHCLGCYFKMCDQEEDTDGTPPEQAG